MQEIVEKLAQEFSLGNLEDFLRSKNPDFMIYSPPERLYGYEEDAFEEIYKIGELKLKDAKNLWVFAIKTAGELTERSSKKRQYEFAKRIIKDSFINAGIFVFYDDARNFRFSLVYSVSQGTKSKFSYYKRYTYYVSPELTNKTFKQALRDADFSSLDRIIEAFSVEKVTEEFFDAYKYALKEVIIKSLSKYDALYEKKHSFAQQLLSRILFIYFLQRKKWFKWKNYVQDKNYIRNLWFKYKDWKESTRSEDVFYSRWLSSLFFGAFNRKSHLIYGGLPEEIKESFNLMPFLNGGLFSRTELDELGFDLPDNVFEWFFEPDDKDKRKGFLEIFNFTIDESSPIDVEVAVDPEMLGRVYESLIAEEERGNAGIFYTPRVEIDFMCRLSLVNYLASEESISKEKIIDFVFEPHNKNIELPSEELRIIKDKLDRVKIVDPAVGSASFLVGMLNILVELHSELTERLTDIGENLFALKERIILENLYGVDVKDWAVMVGELRLWLSLIIETEEKYMDLYTKPLLPNLSFKIRQGDSLVQEIADVSINLKDEMLSVPPSIRVKINELIDRKSSFFSGGRSADLREAKDIEKFEQEIFKEIVEFKIDEVNGNIKRLEQRIRQQKSQKNLFGEKSPDLKKQVKQLEQELGQQKINLDKYNKLINNIGNKTRKNYFLWELDFIEVFSQKGGFDIVIGNPPYVRQELIAPPLENQDNYSDDKWREIKKQYKEKLIQSVKNVWGNNVKIDKKSDLYVYFYYQGLSLLRPGGVFCFINSNSWLDVGYGVGLQEFLLKSMEPLFIIDNLKKRSFKQADVNTVIVLIRRPAEKLDDFTLKFVAFKKPFEEVLNAEVIKKIERADKPIFDDEDFRFYPKPKKELLEEGVEVPEKDELIKSDLEHLPYIGNKWGGNYLRAPEIYFKILEKGKGKLVRLGDVAKIEGYIHDNNTGDKYPKVRFIKSVRDLECILLDIHSEKIIMYGVKKSKKSRIISPIWFPRTLGNVQLIIWNSAKALGKEFYKIIPLHEEKIIPIVFQLNSTFGILQSELLGITNLGGGALKFSRYDIGLFKIIDNLKISLNRFKDFLILKQKGVIEELGFDPNKPIREQEPNPLPDRKALDDIIFDALGLTEKERKEVYWAVAELVKNRLEKARSV
ncbi:MAG: Eco57I restriction-modification methylase domain-containing protein [Candidatus Marinimicrobia bacterium]|nr:Eco57I restriction-modification methylase domain-containing protein [Candidatus Neomarinimicrobiota bacterium]